MVQYITFFSTITYSTHPYLIALLPLNTTNYQHDTTTNSIHIWFCIDYQFSLYRNMNIFSLHLQVSPCLASFWQRDSCRIYYDGEIGRKYHQQKSRLGLFRIKKNWKNDSSIPAKYLWKTLPLYRSSKYHSYTDNVYPTMLTK